MLQQKNSLVLDFLKSGATTGDHLKDALLCIYGLDEFKIGKIVSFADALQQAGGKEILISTTAHRREFTSERTGGSSLVTNHVFGILSGERPSLACKEETSFIDYILRIPVIAWIAWDSSKAPNESTEINAGPFEVHQGVFRDPNTTLLLEAIVNIQAGKMNMEFPSVAIDVGKEIGSPKFSLFPNDVDLIRRRLNEKVAELKKSAPPHA